MGRVARLKLPAEQLLEAGMRGFETGEAHTGLMFTIRREKNSFTVDSFMAGDLELSHLAFCGAVLDAAIQKMVNLDATPVLPPPTA